MHFASLVPRLSPHMNKDTASNRKLAGAWEEASTLHGFDFTNIGAGTKRCGECSGCVAMDCGSCINCKDMKKFGGPGRKKKCCTQRKCVKPGRTHSW